MATYKPSRNEVILLGYEDEPITEKYHDQIGYWTNKIGGHPDWPVDGIKTPTCSLCEHKQLLVVQIYAPLEDSPYHRILYIFCCISPNCWNLSQSWTCRRSQLLDNEKPAAASPNKTEWCSGADEWDDDNGNAMPTMITNSNITDSDDSSSLSTAIGNLKVDQCNANLGSHKGHGAVGKVIASAEIEGDEGEVVSIDTPTAPERDLMELLEATAPLPNWNSATAIYFEPSFMWVCEENDATSTNDHVRSLLVDYQEVHGEVCQRPASAVSNQLVEDDEKYERAIPAHGDAMFHEFVTRLKVNPGHVLRYCRGSLPLLMRPMEPPKSCSNCRSNLVFELQLVSTLLNKLKLQGDNETHVEFGNVLVYTCEKSCWATTDIYRDEVVCVQGESAVGPRQ